MVTLPLILGTLMKEKKQKQTNPKQKNLLPLGWEAAASHHLVAALKTLPGIPVVSGRPLGYSLVLSKKAEGTDGAGTSERGWPLHHSSWITLERGSNSLLPQEDEGEHGEMR